MRTEDLTEVEYTHSFLFGQHEVTQAEWTSLGFPNLAGTKDNGEGGIDCVGATCPAAMLSWYEAVEYTHRLSDRAGLPHCFETLPTNGCTGDGIDMHCELPKPAFKPYTACPGYRLPTLGEFEYAARAGTRTALPTGDLVTTNPPPPECYAQENLEGHAWYCVNSKNRTHPVQELSANGWGIHDLLGNAAEWNAETSDFNGYALRAQDKTKVVEPEFDSGAYGPLDNARGTRGSFYFAIPHYMRSAAIGISTTVNAKAPGLGFRVVRTITADEASRWAR